MSKPTLVYLFNLTALGVGEYFRLCCLFWFGVFATIISFFIIVAILIAYCVGYWNSNVYNCKKSNKSN